MRNIYFPITDPKQSLQAHNLHKWKFGKDKNERDEMERKKRCGTNVYATIDFYYIYTHLSNINDQELLNDRRHKNAKRRWNKDKEKS